MTPAAEVCAEFGISRATLHRWHKQYDLRCESVGSGRRKSFHFDVGHIREVLDARTADQAATAIARQENGKKAAKVRWAGHLKDYALDLEDLAHQSWRGDVDQATWLRVCQWRFRVWPATDEAVLDNLTRWRRRIRELGVPMHLVTEFGEPFVRGNMDNDQPALMRFDWPAVLRWTRHVLD